MGCQKAIAAEIVKAQADYVLSLKPNHRHLYLYLQVAAWFDKSLAKDFTQQAHRHSLQNTRVLSHGRMEEREHWLIEVPEHLKRATKYWANLQTIAMVKRTRQVGEKTSEEPHDYITSALKRGRSDHCPCGAQPL